MLSPALSRSFCEASGAACGAKAGDKVTMSYVGTLEDGTSFDSGDDLTFVIGDGKLIAGFDEGVRNMSVGETKKVVVQPEQGYGAIRDDLRRKVKVSQLPDGVSVGDKLAVGETGRTAVVMELDANADEATLDLNHELAGKTLVFDLTLTGCILAEDVAEQGGFRVEELSPGDGVNFPKYVVLPCGAKWSNTAASRSRSVDLLHHTPHPVAHLTPLRRHRMFCCGWHGMVAQPDRGTSSRCITPGP